MKRRIFRVGARLALVVAGLLAAEAGMHLAAAISPPLAVRLSGLKPRFIVDPHLDVRGDPSLPEYDSAGFRNDTRPTRAAIIAIGDSQTEGSGVARDNAWPQQLAARLDTTVYQMAFGSYGPGHYLALCDDALEFEPETVVVAVYTGNDLAGMYKWVYENGRDPTLAGTDPATTTAIARAERELGPIDASWRKTREAQKGLHDRPVLRWVRANIEERSKLVALYDQLAFHWSGRAAELETDGAPEDWREIRNRLIAVPEEILFPFEARHVRTVLTPKARQRAQDVSDPRIAEGLRMSLAALDRIAEIVTPRARLVVVLIPTKELVFHTAFATTEPAARLAPLVREEAQVRAVLAAHIDARGIARADALGGLVETALRADGSAESAAASPYPTGWDGHPTAAGHAAIAAAVVAALSGPPS